MANLSASEQKMFGKYWGAKDLIDDEAFWADVLLLYVMEERNVCLPLAFNPLTVRRVLDMLECPPGKCGLCCRYKRLPITELDIKKIRESGKVSEEKLATIVQSDARGQFMSCQPECPFLKDNECTIYKYRPDVCYQFPIQRGVEGTLDGQPFISMLVRVKCPPVIKVIRYMLRESLEASEGHSMLLPDLTIIPIWDGNQESPEILEMLKSKIPQQEG